MLAAHMKRVANPLRYARPPARQEAFRRWMSMLMRAQHLPRSVSEVALWPGFQQGPLVRQMGDDALAVPDEAPIAALADLMEDLGHQREPGARTPFTPGQTLHYVARHLLGHLQSTERHNPNFELALPRGAADLEDYLAQSYQDAYPNYDSRGQRAGHLDLLRSANEFMRAVAQLGQHRDYFGNDRADLFLRLLNDTEEAAGRWGEGDLGSFLSAYDTFQRGRDAVAEGGAAGSPAGQDAWNFADDGMKSIAHLLRRPLFGG